MNSEVVGRKLGFTLVELLVVVAIIALLISILLPSLSGARNQARAVKCGANLRSIGQSFGVHLADNRGVFPPSYMYPAYSEGAVDLASQNLAQDSNPDQYGYTHWSWFLYGGGAAQEEAFQCPTMDHGGAPRSFPGPNPADWDANQQVPSPIGFDYEADKSQSFPVVDRQARRMAYTANAAIIPRNKFDDHIDGINGAKRFNKLVSDSAIRRPSKTIAVTEFYNDFRASSIHSSNVGTGSEGDGQAWISKSHRPLQVFNHIGYNSGDSNWEYFIPQNTPGFVYAPVEEQALTDAYKKYGVEEAAALEGASDATLIGLIQGDSIYSSVNAMGRHHPPVTNQRWGGAANVLYLDTHVDRKNVWETMNDREWGDEFYALTGRSEVLDAKASH